MIVRPSPPGNREDQQLAAAPARAQRGEQRARNFLGGITEKKSSLVWKKRRKARRAKDKRVGVGARVGEKRRLS